MNGNEFFSYSFSFTQPWNVDGFYEPFVDTVAAELKRQDDLEPIVLATDCSWVNQSILDMNNKG